MFVFDALNRRKQINGTNGMVDSQPDEQMTPLGLFKENLAMKTI